MWPKTAFFGAAAVLCLSLGLIAYAATADSFGAQYRRIADKTPEPPRLDTAAYDAKLWQIANVGTTTNAEIAAWNAGISTTTGPWPVKAAYPLYGALLPFNRIVAYYGNFYSKQMGVLGEYPEEEMLRMLRQEVAAWEAADPSTPVIPAIDYIAITAQASAGKDGMYRARMPDDQIMHALDLAEAVQGIVFLDIQVGKSDLQKEIELLEPYLALPQVHLSIDPEFAMTDGGKPGEVIGTVNASQVNAAAAYLARLVREHHLPPKVLVVHRFTQPMVTNYRAIKPLPEVQIVMDMDGWGSPFRKIDTYEAWVAGQPVQFTGFKIFYKNDVRPPSTRLLTPRELLQLTPQPSYIQYQ